MTASHQSVSDQVRAVLHDGLRNGELVAGSKLPTERALADQLHAPRTAVRAALAALEREGSITRHVGRGTFVAHGSLDGAGSLLGNGGPDGSPGRSGGVISVPQTSPAEIMQTRLLLEPEVAALAARHATQEDTDHLRHCLRRGESSGSFEEFEAWDSALHRGIARAAHNALLLRLFDTMNAARELPVWGSIKRRSASAERRCGYQAGHTAIVDALSERDADLARDAMRSHLLDVRTNLLGPH
jgi:DNA-binding FadR family transcriptional regulator